MRGSATHRCGTGSSWGATSAATSCRRPSTKRSEGEPAALVGNSYGGFVALDFAARRPELVEKLVLLDAPLMDHDFSPEFMEYVEEEDRLVGAGDTEAAVELNLAFWCPEIADRVRPMAAGSMDIENAELPDPPLGEIRMPTLVAVGEHDKPDFLAI